jgi:hypothetical protein
MEMSWEQWLKDFEAEEIEWTTKTLVALIVAVGDAYAYSLAMYGALLKTGPQEFDEAMEEAIENACIASNEVMARIFEEVGLPNVADRFRHAPHTRPDILKKPD